MLQKFKTGLVLVISHIFLVKCYVNHVAECDGYWNKQKCVPCVDINGICKTNSAEITDCKSGYYLKSVNSIKLCFPCPSKCETCYEPEYGMSLTCSSCQDNNVLILGTCQEIKSCEVINLTLGSCIKCFDGYYMNEQRQCTKCDDSCLTCIEGTVCQTCRDGYSFLDTKFTCTLCDSKTTEKNCKTCVQSETKYECRSCLSSFYFNYESQSCKSCPDYCQNCVSQSNELKCLQCLEDANVIQNVQGKCLNCSNTILNCEKCTLTEHDDLICASCKRSYYYNKATNTCETCPDSSVCNCSKDSCTPAEVTIVQCLDSMILFNNKCEKLTKDKIEKCDKLGPTNESCAICPANYYIENSKCVAITDADLKGKCLIYKQNTQQCLLCDKNLFLEQDKCYSIDTQKCMTQVKRNECVIYQNKYYTFNDQCANKPQTKECGYIEKNGSTLSCVYTTSTNDNCNEYDQGKVGCLYWDKSSRNCLQCLTSENFYLDSSTKKCGKIQSQCVSVVDGTLKCKKCKVEANTYYSETQGVCVICADQKSGYFKCQQFLEESVSMYTTSKVEEKENSIIIQSLKTIVFIIIIQILL